MRLPHANADEQKRYKYTVALRMLSRHPSRTAQGLPLFTKVPTHSSKMEIFVAILQLLFSVCTALPELTISLSELDVSATNINSASVDTRDSKKCYVFLHLRESSLHNMDASSEFFGDATAREKPRTSCT
jgi:hypothetical protein